MRWRITVHPGKGCALDLDGEMRFAGAVVAHMAGVRRRSLMTSSRVGEGFGQQLVDFCGEGPVGAMERFWVMLCSLHPFHPVRPASMGSLMKHDRFHGRVKGMPAPATGLTAPIRVNSVRPACALGL
jgi:hypothetical protein